jgi:C-terminal processing protease CtpA/Prc
LKSIDGLPVEQWLEAARPMAAAGSPQYVRRARLRFLRYIGFLRRELHLPATAAIHVELASSSGNRTTTIDLPLAPKKPVYGEWPRTASHLIQPDNIGYLRLGSMADDEIFLQSLNQAMNEFRHTQGLIIDVRGNGGGLRDGLRTLFPYFMRPDDSPHVVNVAAYRMTPTDGPDKQDGYLADRYLYPVTANVWSPDERATLVQFARDFKPEWTPPVEKFSQWHYAMIRPSKDKNMYFYDRPVIILMDANCFSATEIFLAASKGWRNVTLMGSASGGGSGRPRGIKLPLGSIHIKLSTMASFQPDGMLYNGHGIAPDVNVSAVLTDLIGQTDTDLPPSNESTT